MMFFAEFAAVAWIFMLWLNALKEKEKEKAKVEKGLMAKLEKTQSI